MRILLSLLASIVFLTSCHFMGGERVTGNGHISSQQKNTETFNRVSVSGEVKVHVRQDAANSVRIETDDNLMPYIEVSTKGNTVTIRTKEGYNLDPSKEIIAYVSAPSFENIDVSGACDIIGDSPITGTTSLTMDVSGDGEIVMDVQVPKVSTTISGSGAVTLKGKATDFEAAINGSGKIKCFDFETDNSKIDLSGSADAEITANKVLNVSVSGDGEVKYKGAANVSQNISGSGSVKKVD